MLTILLFITHTIIDFNLQNYLIIIYGNEKLTYKKVCNLFNSNKI